ncbi:SBP-like protein [Artemisia annua]|uniref:Mitochondrial pyruvate carrier n=1 Tax=Artemisia annua TaxID=35608 RepID=A0A2U1ND23_ARTAN|nr:SBP-like protein [Artemisia annua]
MSPTLSFNRNISSNGPVVQTKRAVSSMWENTCNSKHSVATVKAEKYGGHDVLIHSQGMIVINGMSCTGRYMRVMVTRTSATSSSSSSFTHQTGSTSREQIGYNRGCISCSLGYTLNQFHHVKCKRFPTDSNYRPVIHRQPISVTNLLETTVTDGFPTENSVAEGLLCSSDWDVDLKYINQKISFPLCGHQKPASITHVTQMQIQKILKQYSRGGLKKDLRRRKIKFGFRIIGCFADFVFFWVDFRGFYNAIGGVLIRWFWILPLPAVGFSMVVLDEDCNSAMVSDIKIKATKRFTVHLPIVWYSVHFHFWAPTFKWGISIANIADFAKPPMKLSYPQQFAKHPSAKRGSKNLVESYNQKAFRGPLLTTHKQPKTMERLEHGNRRSKTKPDNMQLWYRARFHVVYPVETVCSRVKV